MKKYLPKFLEELPRQTLFSQLEIVLDHNEPDEEEIAWVKEFQEKYPGRIKHIIVPKVEPIGQSMNRCIHQAEGEYVCIWNVDDLRTPNSIESQVKVIQDNIGVGISFGPYVVVRSFGATSGLVRVDDKPTGEEPTRSMITGPFIMFKKTLCEKAGMFDEQLRSGADFDLSVRLNFHTKAATTPDLLGYYLNEGKGASTRPGSLQPLERTVIELRYGIYDKIDYDEMARVYKYQLPTLSWDGQQFPLKDYVPQYADLMLQREAKWYKKGVRNYILKKVFFIKEIKKILHPIKKYIINKA